MPKQISRSYKYMHLLAMLTLVLSIALSFTPSKVALADGSFLCAPTTGNGASLTSCVNRLYTIGIVVASIAAVFMIVLAGYLYMFSGGNESQTHTAKSFISSSLIGLAILLTGLLILKQINPDLLKFKSIQPEQIAARDWVLPDGTLIRSGIQPAGSTPLQPGQDVKQCPEGIIAIPTDIAGKAGESACKSLIEALGLVKSQAAGLGVGFIVTDAYGQGHDSLCHKKYGTCADLVPTNPSPDRWNKLCKAILATSRFRILNEYSLGGAPDCGAYKKTPKATGNHLHIIMQGRLDDLAGQ